MRRLLSLADLPGDSLRLLLRLAAQMKADGPDPSLLAGKQVALLFLNPSLRTRTSMELAAASLGAHAVALTPGADAWKVELRRGVVMDGDAAEHLVDAVRVLSEMVDLVGVRTFGGLRDFAEDHGEPVLTTVDAESSVPVVNMESAMDHPLQALADLLTMQEEHGEDLTGLPVTLTWAPHPRALPMAVASAFLRATARMGMDVRVAAPDGMELPATLVDEARALLPGRGGVRVLSDQDEALRGTKVVYAKAWAAPGLYGDPAAGAAARAAHADWTVTEAKMALGDDAIFMHCLPVQRNMVVADEVLDGPRSRAIREAGNRLHTARAVLASILGGA